MGHEFQLVINQQPAYIAHEYLSPENNAYWREEFFLLLKSFGFDYVADADFNSIPNRIETEYAECFKKEDISDRAAVESADLICYRQMQSPILAHAPLIKAACSEKEFAELYIASPLKPVKPEKGNFPTFRDASGQDIETRNESIGKALTELQPLWPHGRRIKSVFTDIADAREDLDWLLRHQLIELRCIEPGDFDADPEPLNALEQSLRKVSTSAWHITTDGSEK
jgi:hypothetical protein